MLQDGLTRGCGKPDRPAAQTEDAALSTRIAKPLIKLVPFAARLVGAVVALSLLGLVYLAYFYLPFEDRSYRSPYLAQMAARGADAYADAGDFRVHYVRAGKGTPVILLPGGGGWVYDLRDLIEVLATDHTVYAIDPPGSGYTRSLAKDPDYESLYTLQSVDRTLLAFMNRLGIQRASFVGNSWGGGYALYYAQKHPERVSKLVSLDGTGLKLPESWLWELAKWPMIGEAVLKLTATPSFVRESLEHLHGGQTVTDEMVQEYFIPYAFRDNLVAQWVFERNLDWAVTDRLIARMTTPMLIIWGKEDDVLDPHLYIPRWRLLAPKADVVEIEAAGHTPHNAQPGKVGQIVRMFLRE